MLTNADAKVGLEPRLTSNVFVDEGLNVMADRRGEFHCEGQRSASEDSRLPVVWERDRRGEFSVMLNHVS